LPKGTRDFGPQQMLRRNFIFSHIRTVFEKFGFMPLETPAVEQLSVLQGKYGEEGDQLLFKILDSGDFLSKISPDQLTQGYKALTPRISSKGLRYDLTVPFARYVVMNHGDLALPFKRYQIQPVWRADRPQKGRYREFFQCDADVVGTESLIAEAEIVLMITEVFGLLGLTDYTIKISNRKILSGIAQAIGAPGKETELCVAIDKLDKIGRQKVMEELDQRGFGPETITALGPVLDLTEGSNEDMLNALEGIISQTDQGLEGINELRQVFDHLEALSTEELPLRFDVTLARGLSYYTGAIFEVKMNNYPMGSLSGGGRYDNLTSVFGGPKLGGVGFSFGVDRIYDVMEGLDLFPAAQDSLTQIMLVHFDAPSARACMPLLSLLREKGLKAELYPDAAKLKKQMNYANRKNIPYVVLAGSEELAQGLFTLKNMQTGHQENFTEQDLVRHLQQQLNQ